MHDLLQTLQMMQQMELCLLLQDLLQRLSYYILRYRLSLIHI